MDGEPLPPGHWIVAVSPVFMDDERELQWHPPQPVAFSLVEAKRLCDRAVPRRLGIIGNLESRSNGTYQPTNQHKALDVVAACGRRCCTRSPPSKRSRTTRSTSCPRTPW